MAEKLCLSCGMCCNGVIFADVQLQRGDAPGGLKANGLPLRLRGGKTVFPQPCAAFQDCQCKIYALRPKHCRDFECALLKSVLAGKTEFTAARKVVRTAHQRAEKVRQLLRDLGDTEETLALSKRFQRVKKQMDSSGFEEERADTFADLSMAVHELNVLLSEGFYPGA